MIVDVHAHLGLDYTFDEKFLLEHQLDKIQRLEVDVTILQPGTCHNLEDVRREHDDIAAAVKAYPGMFRGMSNPSPHLKDAEYADEIRRCVEELGFIGIKLHPFAHGVNPVSRDGRKVFEAGAKYGVPVMVHTGAGIPFANPINVLHIAKEYPQLKIILAHCGAMLMADETLTVMELCPNVFADTSWTPGFFIREGAHKIGADRFMMGADHADNCIVEITKIKNCGLDERQQELVLGKTAAKIFDIKRE